MTMHDPHHGHSHHHGHGHDHAHDHALPAATPGEAEESHYFDHIYLSAGHDRNARRTLWVVWLTAATMLVEIGFGWLTGSMALLADGFHMATHAGALAVAAAAYGYARRHARNPRYTFGTGKVGDLSGFASALLLGVTALFIAVESIMRFFEPIDVSRRVLLTGFLVFFGEQARVAVASLIAFVFVLLYANYRPFARADDQQLSGLANATIAFTLLTLLCAQANAFNARALSVLCAVATVGVLSAIIALQLRRARQRSTASTRRRRTRTKSRTMCSPPTRRSGRGRSVTQCDF